jgi:opacity protein-like surface antigen
MKKFALVVLSITFSVCVTEAQVDKSFYQKSYESRNNGTFDQSTNLISFGLGIPTIYSGGAYNQSPIFYGKYEHGFLRDEVGLGAYIAGGWGSYDNDIDESDFGAFSLGVLGYYHFNKIIPIEKMDVYAGAGFAFRRFSWDNDFYDNDDSGVIFAFRAGIRYYVAGNFAVYAETGYDDMSSLSFGGTFRF